jgi:hypothetical protein
LIIQLRPHRGIPTAGDDGGGGGKKEEEKKREERGRKEREKAEKTEKERRTGKKLFRTMQSQPTPISGHLQLPYNPPKYPGI